MRQTGLLSASAAYALTHNFPQLPRVHALARRLQDGLQDVGVRIRSAAETCMVRPPLMYSLQIFFSLRIFTGCS